MCCPLFTAYTQDVDFQFSCTDCSVHLAADLQVVLVFKKKKEEKVPKQKTQTPIISISDKQNNWMRCKDLTWKSCEQSCLCLQQLDVYMAVGEVWVQESIRLLNWGSEHCPTSSFSTKMALLEQISVSVSTLLGAFHIPATEIRGWQQVLLKQFTVTYCAYGY